MSDAIRVRVRYDTYRDKQDRTRRERNEAFGVAAPPLIVPPAGNYLWEWYFALSDQLSRIDEHDNVKPIPPSEFIAWCEATRAIVYPSEYAILCAMDVAWRDETTKELIAYRAVQKGDEGES